ncbi:CLUMA_CG003666, isoform A [Clunio marinus]|uniref:CLUMA_CG003666, isoform A n=1 Tax=Clunio marinus TaxID=568069 RepID=A0A1J1HUU9_9DIPT|nr:CLUMA_CG003666, isoform A [Clunio marinus]
MFWYIFRQLIMFMAFPVSAARVCVFRLDMSCDTQQTFHKYLACRSENFVGTTKCAIFCDFEDALMKMYISNHKNTLAEK